jgi:hypothetical protein
VRAGPARGRIKLRKGKPEEQSADPQDKPTGFKLAAGRQYLRTSMDGRTVTYKKALLDSKDSEDWLHLHLVDPFQSPND